MKKKEPWEDKQLQELVKELRITTAPEDIREVQNRIKEKTRELKSSYYTDLADNINFAAMVPKVEKELRQRSIRQSRRNISNDKLNFHFKEHFAARTPELDVSPEIYQPENFTHLNDVGK